MRSVTTLQKIILLLEQRVKILKQPWPIDRSEELADVERRLEEARLEYKKRTSYKGPKENF